MVVRGRLGAGESSQWQFVNGNCVQREDAGAFYVDKAYSGSNNSDVFEDIRYIVDGATEGISGGIFAYGVRAGAAARPRWRKLCVLSLFPSPPLTLLRSPFDSSKLAPARRTPCVAGLRSPAS